VDHASRLGQAPSGTGPRDARPASAFGRAMTNTNRSTPQTTTQIFGVGDPAPRAPLE